MLCYKPPTPDDCKNRAKIEKLLSNHLKALSLQAKGVMWEGHCLTCRLYETTGDYLGVAFFPIKKISKEDPKGTLGAMVNKTVSLFKEIKDVQGIL